MKQITLDIKANSNYSKILLCIIHVKFERQYDTIFENVHVVY